MLAVIVMLTSCLGVAAGEPRAAGSAHRTLDLEQAIQLAVGDNLRLSLQDIGPARSRLTVEGAGNRFALNLFPTIVTEVEPSSAGSNSRSGETLTLLGLDASKRFRLGAEFRFNAGQTLASGSAGSLTRWSVEVSQPLLRRFGRLINAEPEVASQSALAASERALLLQEADLVLDVVVTYHDILRLQRQVAADEKAQERIELLARVTAAKERLGRATRIDSLRVALQLGEIRARLQNTHEALGLARSDLAVLLGATYDALFELQPVPVLELELPSLEDAIGVALANRLDYSQALQDVVDNRRGVRIARRGRLPDVSAFVRYQDERIEGVPSGSPAGGRVLFGLSAGHAAFARDRRLDVERALLDQAASVRRTEIARQVVERSVQRVWLSYRKARSRISILQRNLEHARARMELASRLFRMGRGDNFSVIDGEASQARAERDLFTGEVEVTVEAYRLLRSLGTLVEVPQRLKPRSVNL